jgi:signal peptidase I
MPILHTGMSMMPLLKPGDWLLLGPYGEHKVVRGDVVVFPPRDRRRHIAHRVVSVGPEGIRTRGDRALEDDPWIVSPKEILGRVSSSWGKTGFRNIHGGWRGFLQAKAAGHLYSISLGRPSILSVIYHRTASWGPLRRFFPLDAKTRVIRFERSRGSQWQLLLGKHVIGLRPSEDASWMIRRPFLLFLDPKRLPEG